MRIYVRILEKSCVPNTAFDKLLLVETPNDKADEGQDDPLVSIAAQLDRDVRAILSNPEVDKRAQQTKQGKTERKQQRRKSSYRKISNGTRNSRSKSLRRHRGAAIRQ